jgi:hypothetical protein
MKTRTVVFQFEHSKTRALTKILMEKTSNGMTFRGHQLHLRLIFAGIVHRSEGRTLQQAGIGRRTMFWEDGQLSVALSRVKTEAISEFHALMIWMISLFAHPLT